MRFDGGSVPVGDLVFSSKTKTVAELQDAALFKVRPLFATLPGVSAPSSTDATSRMKTVCVPCDRIGMLLRSLNCRTTELTGTIGMRSPMRTLPDGLTVLPAPNARTTSSGDMLYERSFPGSKLTMMVRWLEPKGGGAETPRRRRE